MAVDLNKIWDAVKGNYKTAWNLSRSSGWTGARATYRGAKMAGASSKFDRKIVSYAARGISGAMMGAAVGGAWGAVSDRESIVGGALKGAFVGAGIRIASRGLNPMFRAYEGGRNLKGLRGMQKLTQVKNFGANIKRSWDFMSTQRNKTLRNFIVGAGALGALRGMGSGEDNPLGGAAGGIVAGGVQGAALYGGYRGLKYAAKKIKV